MPYCVEVEVADGMRKVNAGAKISGFRWKINHKNIYVKCEPERFHGRM